MKTEANLVYPEGKLVDVVELAAGRYPRNIAYEFMGRESTYTSFMKDIDKCARALTALGVREDDIVCISMPNVPQAIIFLYALNKIGAVANMLHPLSSEGEMKDFINRVGARTILLMDQFYGSIKNIRSQTPLKNVIIASVSEALPVYKRLPYKLTAGRKIKPLKASDNIIRWNDFLKGSSKVSSLPEISDRTDKTALILHSGGTTGKIKGVCLSNLNVNAAGMQLKAANPMMGSEDKMLTVMPIFHGNGLVIGVHAMMISGAKCVLIPRFTPESYAKDLLKHKCNFMSGVPALYEKMIKLDIMQKADLSFLKGVFSGADSLTVDTERRINRFLKDHNSPVTVRQGYGMTEGVVACSEYPITGGKEGSIGIPLPDTEMKIVKPGTDNELPPGEVGEIVFTSAANMMGYYNDEEETANTLRLHSDGQYWIHSGDLGTMDEDGVFFFKGRIKRMIVSNGYNIFPLELENVIKCCPLVENCCVLGIPDKERGELVKLFVVLKKEITPSDEVRKEIMKFCKKGIARYALPRKIDFLDTLPTTKIGKIDYNRLLNGR